MVSALPLLQGDQLRARHPTLLCSWRMAVDTVSSSYTRGSIWSTCGNNRRCSVRFDLRAADCLYAVSVFNLLDADQQMVATHLAVQLAEVAVGCALRSGRLLELLVGLLHPRLNLADLSIQQRSTAADCKGGWPA